MKKINLKIMATSYIIYGHEFQLLEFLHDDGEYIKYIDHVETQLVRCVGQNDQEHIAKIEYDEQGEPYHLDTKGNKIPINSYIRKTSFWG